MLTKIVYKKVLKSLEHIRNQWEEDRRENPRAVPYEIDDQLRSAIERHIREGRMNCHGKGDVEYLVNQTIEYLLDKKLVTGSPYGGIMFPLPPDHPPLPTKEELVAAVRKQLRG